MKKSLLLLFVLLLAACSQQQAKTEPSFYQEEVIPMIVYTLAIQYVTEDGLVDPPQRGVIETGQTIRVTATVENTGKSDYTFSGNPCSGDLTVALQKGDKKIDGIGDVTADFCIQSYLEHNLKAGEKIKATAEFNLEEAETGKYELSVSYANKRLVRKVEIVERP